MKTYITTVFPSQHKLFELLCASVNRKFDEKIKSKLKLTIIETDQGIEIGQPDVYDMYLYHIVVKGHNLVVNKSEHYIDDINSLALEDIIDSIIYKYLGLDHVETILQP